jgi:phenylalanyl-tRNA synthetase beta chain
MICDAEKPVAIAGVMGGANSEVSEYTTNLLIESAYFNPSSIRRTAKHLGLSTDSSYRFERGCNPEITDYAANRAAQLIVETGGGVIAKGLIDVYPKTILPRKVTIRYSRIEKILGFNIPPEDVKNILNNLGLKILSEEEGSLVVNIPPFRHDIEREIDLIEEVARIYGYDKIPTVDRISITLDVKVDQSYFNDNLRSSLISLGFSEIITNSLLNEDTALTFGNAVRVMNPQSMEMSHIRPSLLPGAFYTISRNIKVKETNLMLFEIGNVVEKLSEGQIVSFDNFQETEYVLLVLSGNNSQSEWYGEEREFDIYDLKGIANEIIRNISLDNILNDSYHQSEDQFLEYGFEKKSKEDTLILKGGKIRSNILDAFDITQNVFVLDVNLSNLKGLKKADRKFEEVLKYPKIIKDISFIVDEKIGSDVVQKTIYEGSTKLLKNVKLFDIFESESLGENKKSLTYQLEYFDTLKTLTDEEVEKDFWKAIETVKSKLNAQLRGN